MQDSVTSLMNSQVISVLPDTPILAAIDILLSNNYNGIPVVDKAGILTGILTKYDLIIKKGYIRDDTKVAEVMNKDPLVLAETMTIEDAIVMFSEHHKVDPIPVIDGERKIIGVISRFDIVKLLRTYGATLDPDAGGKKSERSSLLPLIIIVAIAALAGFLYYYGYFNSLFGQLF